jgi:hypothetical protein
MKKEGNMAQHIMFICNDLMDQKKKLRCTFAVMLRQDSFGNLKKQKLGPVVTSSHQQ